ncbi:MAG: hypothetical protein HC831_31030 [Chloroflexia bacterium]|nr:hypothetical protein [Chloroflexia bacterium]
MEDCKTSLEREKKYKFYQELMQLSDEGLNSQIIERLEKADGLDYP